MKKIILFFMLLIMSVATFSQQTVPSQDLTKQDYLQKSKSQKGGAWLLLGSGTAVLAGTLISAASSICFSGCTKRKTPVVPISIGSAMIVGSVPLFIASSRNKRKSMSLSFKNEMAPQLLKGSFVYQTVPSLTLKISL